MLSCFFSLRAADLSALLLLFCPVLVPLCRSRFLLPSLHSHFSKLTLYFLFCQSHSAVWVWLWFLGILPSLDYLLLIVTWRASVTLLPGLFQMALLSFITYVFSWNVIVFSQMFPPKWNCIWCVPTLCRKCSRCPRLALSTLNLWWGNFFFFVDQLFLLM